MLRTLDKQWSFVAPCMATGRKQMKIAGQDDRSAIFISQFAPFAISTHDHVNGQQQWQEENLILCL
jgi:hypothetical protein